ncbi:HPr family phosphocarrier protein [Candidatus Desantisbacteria bacterium]|nr:HPr family phosphocarrier protein [Candidatus Desantisbacteria bacterium]
MRIEKELVLKNKLGLHARPAAMFVQVANKFKSDIFLSKDSQSVNGKSIMGILTLAAEHGSIIHIVIDGPDAESMMSEVVALFESCFREI